MMNAEYWTRYYQQREREANAFQQALNELEDLALVWMERFLRRRAA
jgi:hypothetical protein